MFLLSFVNAVCTYLFNLNGAFRSQTFPYCFTHVPATDIGRLHADCCYVKPSENSLKILKT